VTDVISFVVGIFGRIVSGICTTYIVRFLDKIKKKQNDRPEK